MLEIDRIRYRLSPLTIGFGAYLIVSASFMQQVWKIFTNLMGSDKLQTLCLFLYFWLGIIVVGYTLRSGFSFLRLFGSLLILILSFLFAWSQPFFVEKMHVLEYAVLGWLAIRDLSKIPQAKMIKRILFAVFFTVLIGVLDEGFQKILPYRVGEIRDVLTNVIGSGFGIVLFLTNR